MRELRPCGTPAAYRRHLRRGEVPCRPCLEAEARRRRPGSPRRKPPQHGTDSKYSDGCRCAPCTAAHTESLRAWRAAVSELAQAVPELVPHGAGGYRNYGCRCPVCTEANRAACSDYRAARRAAR